MAFRNESHNSSDNNSTPTRIALLVVAAGVSASCIYSARLYRENLTLRRKLRNRTEEDDTADRTGDGASDIGSANAVESCEGPPTPRVPASDAKANSTKRDGHATAAPPARDERQQKSGPPIEDGSERQGERRQPPRDMSYTMREIGTVTSPHPQRAGTPRQGLLAPHSRSHLVLHPHIPMEAVEDITEYSHVWVVFQFHLNDVGRGRDAKARRGLSGQNKFKGSKVCPPRAGGKRVGVLATRSPHRPNNVGLSLARLEGVGFETYHDHHRNHDNDNDGDGKKGKKSRKNGKSKARKRIVVKLLGLDLVDGTPVYDIKPYLPWDSVGFIDTPLPITQNKNDNSNNNDNNNNKVIYHSKKKSLLRFPLWVDMDDELSSVSWTDEAKECVRRDQEGGALSPLYEPLSESLNNGDNDQEACQAISEIIAQDPRARHEGRGRGMTENDDPTPALYEITFCTLRIGFRVVRNNDLLSSFDEEDARCYVADIITVIPDKGDITAQPGSYQHSLALRRSAEAEFSDVAITDDKAGKCTRLLWANPVREGVTSGLYDLKGGSVWSGGNSS